MALVSCDRVGQTLTEWLGTATQQQRDNLCNALDCGPEIAEILGKLKDCKGDSLTEGSVVALCEDLAEIGNFETSDSVEVSGSGSTTNPYKADVKVFQDFSNALEKTQYGLKVDPATILKQLTDCNNTPLRPGDKMATCVDVGVIVANAINNLPADNFLQNVSLTPDGKQLQFELANGSSIKITVSDLIPIKAGEGLTGLGTGSEPLKVKLKNVPHNKLVLEGGELFVSPELPTNGAKNTVLTTDGYGNIGWHPAPDSGLSSVAALSTSTVSVSGNGNSDNPLQANIKVSSEAGNEIVVKSDGIFVKPSAEEQPLAAQDTATVELVGQGTTLQPLKANVKLSNTPGNAAKLLADGLMVEVPDVEVQTTTSPSGSITNGTELPTQVMGGRMFLLGEPAGWVEFPAGSGQKIPFWN